MYGHSYWAQPGFFVAAPGLRWAGLVAFLLAVLVSHPGIVAVHQAATQPDFTFYSSAARAWELGIGGVIAICVSRNVLLPRAWAGAASVVGIAMVCLGVSLIKSGATFPVPLAIWPVLGAALLIAGNSGHPDNFVCRFLSTGPLVQIGLASYAWYLWHWPALAISRAVTPGHVNFTRDIILAIATFLLAMATLYLYERPLRFHGAFKTMIAPKVHRESSPDRLSLRSPSWEVGRLVGEICSLQTPFGG